MPSTNPPGNKSSTEKTAEKKKPREKPSKRKPLWEPQPSTVFSSAPMPKRNLPFIPRAAIHTPQAQRRISQYATRRQQLPKQLPGQTHPAKMAKALWYYWLPERKCDAALRAEAHMRILEEWSPVLGKYSHDYRAWMQRRFSGPSKHKLDFEIKRFRLAPQSFFQHCRPGTETLLTPLNSEKQVRDLPPHDIPQPERQVQNAEFEGETYIKRAQDLVPPDQLERVHDLWLSFVDPVDVESFSTDMILESLSLPLFSHHESSNDHNSRAQDQRTIGGKNEQDFIVETPMLAFKLVVIFGDSASTPLLCANTLLSFPGGTAGLCDSKLVGSWQTNGQPWSLLKWKRYSIIPIGSTCAMTIHGLKLGNVRGHCISGLMKVIWLWEHGCWKVMLQTFKTKHQNQPLWIASLCQSFPGILPGNGWNSVVFFGRENNTWLCTVKQPLLSSKP